MIQKLVGRFLKWLEREREMNARIRKAAYESNGYTDYDQPAPTGPLGTPYFFPDHPVIPKNLADADAHFPHCDSEVLHAPGECVYCDKYPQRQAARKRAAVNFTGHNDLWKCKCPSELRRDLGTINAWVGNRPQSYDSFDRRNIRITD